MDISRLYSDVNPSLFDIKIIISTFTASDSTFQYYDTSHEKDVDPLRILCALNLETFNISRKIYHLNEAFGTTQCSSSVLCIYILYVKIYSTPRTADDSQVINLYRAKIAFKKTWVFFMGQRCQPCQRTPTTVLHIFQIPHLWRFCPGT